MQLCPKVKLKGKGLANIPFAFVSRQYHSGAASQVSRRNGEMNGIEEDFQFVNQTVPKLPERIRL